MVSEGLFPAVAETCEEDEAMNEVLTAPWSGL